MKIYAYLLILISILVFGRIKGKRQLSIESYQVYITIIFLMRLIKIIK
ncbi:hypothetical protein P368_20240 [Comamonas thiooxydans]|nr:hypothetical protein P369_22930 [Comamonas thiooxydans]KGG96339.1 hypothetical protein P367_19585 [Comamonas thiooxydans]KGH02772.1 hypothetical protein P365_17950 [Comamonas thiooxydans]KGH07757.1 hypothetical protein P368_20240 [Comamonas thiooxydans]